MTREFCHAQHFCHHWFENDCTEACDRDEHNHPHGDPKCSDE